MMNSLVRALGMLLRLVGISSPEDTRPKAKSTAEASTWREPAKPERPASQERRE